MGRRSRPRARQSRSAAPQVRELSRLIDACMKVSFSRNQERRYARQPRNSNLAGAATATAITRCARPPPPGGASYRISLGFSYLGPCLSSAAFRSNLLRLVQAAACTQACRRRQHHQCLLSVTACWRVARRHAGANPVPIRGVAGCVNYNCVPPAGAAGPQAVQAQPDS